MAWKNVKLCCRCYLTWSTLSPVDMCFRLKRIVPGPEEESTGNKCSLGLSWILLWVVVLWLSDKGDLSRPYPDSLFQSQSPMSNFLLNLFISLAQIHLKFKKFNKAFMISKSYHPKFDPHLLSSLLLNSVNQKSKRYFYHSSNLLPTSADSTHTIYPKPIHFFDFQCKHAS